MSHEVSAADFTNLSVDERLRLVEELWDSIAAVPEAVPVTAPQRQEIQARLEEYRANRTNFAPWSEVRDRLLGKRGA